MIVVAVLCLVGGVFVYLLCAFVVCVRVFVLSLVYDFVGLTLAFVLSIMNRVFMCVRVGVVV